VQYLSYAGENALQRSAHREAIDHLTTGLQLLTRLPETPERLQQELGLQAALGPALIATKGYAAPEVEHTYARAHALCQCLGETPQLFPILFGLWVFYLVRAAPLQPARELAERLLNIATHQDEPALLLEAHAAYGTSLCHSGDQRAALAHLEAGQALYDPQQHQAHAPLYGQDPGVACLSYGAITLWLLGSPDQALLRAHEAMHLAQQLTSPFSLAYAYFFLSLVHQHRRELPATREHAETLLDLATAHHFPYWIAFGMMLSGWVRAMEGQHEEGMVALHQGLAFCQTIGGTLARTHWLSLLAEVCGRAGQHAAGLTTVEEALTLGDMNGEQHYRAELYRLKGELLLTRSMARTGEAEACFQEALAVARHQHAKSWELRAALSLARLWQRQGKRAAAQELLVPVYAWFTEGFETADLQEAKGLLEELV
jgi:predicted ATPase